MFDDAFYDQPKNVPVPPCCALANDLYQDLPLGSIAYKATSKLEKLHTEAFQTLFTDKCPFSEEEDVILDYVKGFDKICSGEEKLGEDRYVNLSIIADGLETLIENYTANWKGVCPKDRPGKMETRAKLLVEANNIAEWLRKILVDFKDTLA